MGISSAVWRFSNIFLFLFKCRKLALNRKILLTNFGVYIGAFLHRFYHTGAINTPGSFLGLSTPMAMSLLRGVGQGGIQWPQHRENCYVLP